jgi:class 3 adenylate cyclase
MQKNLTVMFTDISGFTRHTETITRDELMSRLDTHNQLLMPIIAHFEGKIVKTIGDAFLITFESPTNAVQCGLFMQHTLRQHNAGKPEPQQIHIKISINSGEVTVTENDVFGDPVNVSAKIEKATNPDEIYFTEAVFLAMNKAEVPTSFVKTFRPKGAESQEIKLYRVAMDEGDERYQRVVNATHIDADKVKTRALELSNAAEKEFTRYQDTLDALVQTQGASSRNTIIAVVAAALILAIAIVAGFAMFAGGETPEQQLTRDVRAYLTAGKPQDARDVIQSHMQKHGQSDAVSELLVEVDTFELNDAAKRAEQLLDAGEPAKARATLLEALRDKTPGETHQRVLDRAQAYVDAAAALNAGDTARVLEATDKAAGSAGFSEPLKKLRDQAEAIDEARQIIADEPRLKDQAAGVIERLTASFGDRPAIPAVNDLLVAALKARMYWEARTKPWEDTKKLMEGYKSRLIGIGNWREVEREMYLGGFWSYVGRNEHNDRWWDWNWSPKWQEMHTFLSAEAESDPAFSFRLGSNIFDINRAKNLVITVEQFFIGRAIKAKPDLLQQNRARLVEMCKVWLLYDNVDANPARELTRRHLYADLKPYLLEGLYAINRYDEGKPDFSRRQNSFALLADRGDLGIEDPFAYFRDNFEIFMENAWAKEGTADSTALTREQVQALFRMKMSAVEYNEFKTLLEKTLEDINARTGRWSGYTFSRQTAQTMLEDLKAAQPEHAATGG